jgi:predicted esterase
VDCLSLDEEDGFVKTLQDSEERTYIVNGPWQLKTIEFKPPAAKSITLLLHGYNERGLRIYRKLKRFLPKDTHIIAPNAPFPLPRVKPDRLDFGFAWYFYDRFSQSYHVDQNLVLELLKNLLKVANPLNLPVTIIGFSQGGYLAPLVAYNESNTKHVIGIGCEFRTRFFTSPPTFTLDAIHGSADPLVSCEHAKVEIDLLKDQGINVGWHMMEDLKHEISNDVALTISKLLEQYGEASL